MRWFLFRGRQGCELLVVPGSDPQAGLWDSGGENHVPAHTPEILSSTMAPITPR